MDFVSPGYVSPGYVNPERRAVGRVEMGTGRLAAGLGPAPGPRTTVLTVVRPGRLFCEVFSPALEGPA